MQTKTWLTLLCIAGATSLLAACGEDDPTPSGTTTSGSGTTTGAGGSTSATTGSGGEGGSTSATTGSGGGAPTTVNGCDLATAVDMTLQDIEVQFPMNGLGYEPACVKISKGHSVSFTAVSASSFAAHPLVGGTVEGTTATPDPASPIPTTSSGTLTVVSFDEVGTYGYYCDFHFASGMFGAVFVVP